MVWNHVWLCALHLASHSYGVKSVVERAALTRMPSQSCERARSCSLRSRRCCSVLDTCSVVVVGCVWVASGSIGTCAAPTRPSDDPSSVPVPPPPTPRSSVARDPSPGALTRLSGRCDISRCSSTISSTSRSSLHVQGLGAYYRIHTGMHLLSDMIERIHASKSRHGCMKAQH